MSRLMALSRSHDLPTERNWVSAPLRDAVRRTLAPLVVTGQASGRFVIAGEDYELHPKPALAIAMGLHELATNAVEYGARSNENVKVDLAWTLVPDGIMRLSWAKRGGPVVLMPERIGSGLRMIQQGLAHELAAQRAWHFVATG